MLVASKLNMRGIEKESEKEPKQPFFVRICDISFVKHVPRKFHAVVVQQQRQRKVPKKSTLHVQYGFFAN